MLGVILAAGRGARLMPITAEKPKPLVEVGQGISLLELSVRSLMASGLKDLVVVVGYRGEEARRAAEKLRSLGAQIAVIENPEYWRGNGLSLLKARDAVGSDEFVLAMCDHLVEPAIYRAAAEAGPFCLCVDKEPAYLLEPREATKVLLGPGETVRAIGKGLTKWDAVDMGVFCLSEPVFYVLEELVREKALVSLSDCVRSLVARGVPVRALDMTGSLWTDVDTLDALEHARALVLPKLLEALG